MTRPPLILLVDDDQLVRLTLFRHLSGRGWKVVCAESGEEALDLLKSQSFDLVLSDVMMPGMDGFHLALHIADRGHLMPVVLISGAASGPMRRRALQVGARALLAKPPSPEDLDFIAGLLPQSDGGTWERSPASG